MNPFKKYTANLIIPVIFMMASAIFSSCEKVNVDAYTQQAVVESYLEDGVAPTVTITKESLYVSGDTNVVQTPINGLAVKIINAGKTYALVAKGSGVYTATGLLAKAGQSYDLSFDYNGKTVTATTTVPANPTGVKSDATSITILATFGASSARPDPINITWENPTQEYYYVAVVCTEVTPVELVRPSFFGKLPSTRNNRRFTNSPVNGTTSAIQQQNFRYKGTHEIIVYKVNPEYVKLYESSGSNSLNISTPPTNIKNGLGIFTGAGRVSLPLLVKQ